MTDELTRARKNCVSLLGGEDGEDVLLEPMVESLSKGASAPLKAAENVRLLEAALLTLSTSDLTLVRTWLVVAAEKPGFHGIDAEVARRLGLEPCQVSRRMAELRKLLFGALGGPDAYFSN